MLMGAFEYVLYKNVRLGKSSTKPILNVRNSNFINVKISFLNVKMAGGSILKHAVFEYPTTRDFSKYPVCHLSKYDRIPGGYLPYYGNPNPIYLPLYAKNPARHLGRAGSYLTK